MFSCFFKIRIMATSRTTKLSKSVVNNFALFKRVVSTSAPSQKHIDELTTSTAVEYPTMTVSILNS